MWFKVDDQLPRKSKARKVRRSHPTKARDVAPFGIWVIAGALTDTGWISLEELLDWDDDAEALAERLVAATLWHHEERDGEPGYLFNDWADHNPSTGAKDSGSFGAHIRHHVKKKLVNPDCPHCPKEPEPYSPEELDEPSPLRPPTRDLDRPLMRTLSKPDPTRPDPTTSTDVEVSCSSAAAESVSDSIDTDFADWWSHYPRKIGKGQAIRAYRAARKKVDHHTLMAAVIAQSPRLMEKGTNFCPHPATWLNGERWADDLTVVAGTVIPARQQHTDDIFARAAVRMGVTQ